MSTPTLIDLPPPPSDPVTPSDMGPGTPNSGTTSLSAISTTAIKDGHQGNRHAHSRHAHRSSSASDTSTNTLDAERADRISRLAGLERVATARAGGNSAGSNSLNPQGPTSMAGFAHQTPPGYFDTVHANLTKERSTVGSASATGSIGRTTWASGSDIDADKTTEDPDDGISSTGGLSDEGNSSIVGFGEGAGSTVSGPVSTAGGPRTTAARQASGMAGTYSPSTNRPPSNVFPPHLQPYAGGIDSGIPPSSPSPAGSNTPEPPLSVTDGDDARMVDGMTFDSDVVDTAARPPRPVVVPDSRTSSGGT